MNATEVREVVAELHMAEAVVDIAGRVKLDDGTVLAEASGVHRKGALAGGNADARWFETVMEWHERSPA